MKRRDFMQVVSGSLAWLGLGSVANGALFVLPGLKDFTLHAQIGHMFPPLGLVHRLRNNELSEMEYVTEGDLGSFPLSGSGDARTIYVGLRMREFDPNLHHGNLQDGAREEAVRRIDAFARERFGWRTVRTTFEQNPAFWYPYSGKGAGSLVFCRLVFRDAAPRASLSEA